MHFDDLFIVSFPQLASQLIKRGNDGELSFTVNNKTVVVTSADNGPSFVIIDNGKLVHCLFLSAQFYLSLSLPPRSVTTGTNYLPLIIGLSVGSFVAVLLLVIVVVLAIVYWKK